MPHVFQEKNWHVYPALCSRVYLNRNQVDFMYEHIARHFPSALKKMQKMDDSMIDVLKTYSGFSPSDRNLNLGNFAIAKSSSHSEDEYVMVFPDSLSGTDMRNCLTLLETYLMRNGHVPVQVSQYTSKAFSNLVTTALKANGYTAERELSMTPFTMKDRSHFHSLRLNTYDQAEIVTHSLIPTPSATKMVLGSRAVSGLGVEDMQRMLPVVKMFCEKFPMRFRKQDLQKNKDRVKKLFAGNKI